MMRMVKFLRQLVIKEFLAKQATVVIIPSELGVPMVPVE
jgi:hypothetical protein